RNIEIISINGPTICGPLPGISTAPPLRHVHRDIGLVTGSLPGDDQVPCGGIGNQPVHFRVCDVLDVAFDLLIVLGDYPFVGPGELLGTQVTGLFSGDLTVVVYYLAMEGFEGYRHLGLVRHHSHKFPGGKARDRRWWDCRI